MKEETTKSCVDGGERHLYQVPYEVKLSGDMDSFLSGYSEYGRSFGMRQTPSSEKKKKKKGKKG